MSSRRKPAVKAVVRDIVQGKHGPYVITSAEEIDGSLTFSLDSKVWKGETNPENGEIVLLSKLKKKQAGWRAMHAEPYSILKERLAMSNKHLAKAVTQVISKWNQVFRFEETEKIWREWVDFARREWGDLRDLMVDGQYQASFRARAVFIVLTPLDDAIPFYWEGDRVYQDWLTSFDDPVLPKLSSDLVKFCTDLGLTFYEFAKHDRKLDDYDREKLLNAYNDLLIELLSVLAPDSDMARSVFKSLELNDPTVWWNMDFASGYNPFSRLIRHSGIPETWKVQADEAMRNIVKSEVSGRRRPRADHEEALSSYIHDVIVYLYYLKEGKEIYSRTLFFDQIRFILDITPDGYQNLHSLNVGGVLQAASKAGEEKLILNLTRFVAMHSIDPYNVSVSEQFLKVSLGEPELEAYFRHVINQRHERADERKRLEQERQAKEQAILDQMKD